MGAMGTTGTRAEGMVETGAKGIAEMDVASVVRGVTMGIVVSAATSGSSKVFAIRGTNMQSGWRLYYKVRQIIIKGRRKKKAMRKGEGKNLTNIRDTYPWSQSHDHHPPPPYQN